MFFVVWLFCFLLDGAKCIYILRILKKYMYKDRTNK